MNISQLDHIPLTWIPHSTSFQRKAYSTTNSQLRTDSMSSSAPQIMQIPLIFCGITKCISETDSIKFSRINKYLYDSLAKYVNLTKCFTMEQLNKNKKFQIRTIRISSSEELRELLVHPSCTKIYDLVFDDVLNYVIEQYPSNIKKITFEKNYNQPTDNLPESVTHVTFGYDYNQPTNNLPASVTHVTFGWSYNKPTNNLPASVTHVTFGGYYNQPTNKLPASITHVTFGEKYDQPTDNLPASVTHVTFGYYYNHPLDKLPSSVKEVEIGECWDYNVSTIPEHVSTVKRKWWCDEEDEYKYEILR
jgi:ferredoxin-fold anticodon binding domain-containing protein